MYEGRIKMKKMFKNTSKAIAFLIISMTIITITGCSNNKREDAIEYVIKQIYQAPDSELITLSERMEDDIEEAAKDKKDIALDDSEFFINLAKRYEDYITPECYEKLISQRIPYKYHLSMADLGFTMKVLSIDIDRNSKSANIYDFTADIRLGSSENNEKNVNIVGSAQFEKKGNRINFLRLLDEDLQKEIEAQ
jgi:hypothetical protein